jgi:hypothetical protein
MLVISILTPNPAKTKSTRDHILAARFASELFESITLTIKRAQGRPGAGRTHGLRAKSTR